MEKRGGLCGIGHFDLCDITVVTRGFPVILFLLDFENEFYFFMRGFEGNAIPISLS